ncbi:Oidioi.mRNA.OKI2018_I69.chr2.g4887.t1.cds [Oikopleura dioica]|uniref:Oidioi.mRNA.OKI2018_I69.chr2.g4887.t1.cds n=1 Tax=Oikopleura dioica TaxID=34765 RepID=A0ABN7T584_OIKDI|nr:Oidioi.mRNA.OKI2018_I69.chr2.g4887.t1.cds [Oikopleura dioica]
MRSAALNFLLGLIGLKSTEAVPTFTLGSTGGKTNEAPVDYDDLFSNYDSYYNYNYYGAIPTQCGLSFDDEGYFESEHPYMARTSCMYNVTASEEIEIRVSRLQLEVTEDCLYDNIQVYTGHDMLSVFCGENPYQEWTKIDSRQFGVFFDGFSGGHYGFKMHWRPVTQRNRLSELGFIELVNHKYERLISARQQKAGNKTFRSRLIAKFATLVENVFDNKDRQEKLRKCAIEQGAALESSEIPSLYRIQIETATTTSKIMEILMKVIERQDDLCRNDGRRNPDHPKRWLTWFNWRSEKLESLKNKNLVM